MAGEGKLACPTPLLIYAQIIDKKLFFQGRSSIPRGNNFYTIRVYAENVAPYVHRTVSGMLIAQDHDGQVAHDSFGTQVVATALGIRRAS